MFTNYFYFDPNKIGTTNTIRLVHMLNIIESDKIRTDRTTDVD